LTPTLLEVFWKAYCVIWAQWRFTWQPAREGASGYLNREQLTHALLPMVTTNLEMKEVVGGQSSALQFYDGEHHDVFVLSAGLHHYMCIVFAGDGGARQLGAVTRYGRRAAEDLIALLGANAWMIERTEAKPEASRPARKEKRATEEVEPVKLEPAQLPFAKPAEVAPEPEPAPILEPIPDLDLDKLFGQSVDTGNLDDLFDPDKLEEVAKQARKGKEISFDDAIQLGVIQS